MPIRALPLRRPVTGSSVLVQPGLLPKVQDPCPLAGSMPTEAMVSVQFYGGLTCHNRRALNRGTPMKAGGSRRRGPDLATKPGFSNFTGHLDALGRPMEGHVDLYHTTVTFHGGAIRAIRNFCR